MMTNEATKAAYILYCDEWGVFLGVAIGMAFWSKLDPVGQVSAPIFECAEDARPLFEAFPRQDIRMIEVVADLGDAASMSECVRVGLPGWLSEQSPVANRVPC